MPLRKGRRPQIKEVEILKNEVYGAILGKALYLGAIDLKEALKYSV